MKNITQLRRLIILILIVSANISMAQRDSSRKQFRDEIQKVMKQKLMENLNIDETTTDRFINTYKENNKSIKILIKEKKEIQKSIELDPGAADIEAKLDNYMGIDSKIIESRLNYYKELKTFLTPEQIAKSIIVRKKFENELKKQLKKRGKNNKFKEQNEDLK